MKEEQSTERDYSYKTNNGCYTEKKENISDEKEIANTYMNK